MRLHPCSRAGFTLAEAAVTIALVAITLTVLLQSMEGSKFMAAHTRDQKIARELALNTLYEIEAGLWQEDLDLTRSGNYAEQDHPQFWWELAIGEESFDDDDDRDRDRDRDAPFDNWAYREEQRQEALEDSGVDEDEEATDPFEKVRIRVSFSQYGDLVSEVTLERWIPWEQVYGEDEEVEEDGGGTGPGATTGSQGSDASAPGGPGG